MRCLWIQLNLKAFKFNWIHRHLTKLSDQWNVSPFLITAVTAGLDNQCGSARTLKGFIQTALGSIPIIQIVEACHWNQSLGRNWVC